MLVLSGLLGVWGWYVIPEFAFAGHLIYQDFLVQEQCPRPVYEEIHLLWLRSILSRNIVSQSRRS